MLARLHPHAHERHVAQHNLRALPVHRRGEALVVRDGEDDQPGLLRVDVRGEATAVRLKPVAGVFPQARGAFPPVRNGVHIEPLHALAVARQILVRECGGGEQHVADRLRVHLLVMGARADRLQKAHRHGGVAHIDRGAVLLPVVDKALRDGVAQRRVLRPLMVFGDGEQGVERRVLHRGGHGCRFIKAQPRQRHEPADGRGAQRREARQRGLPAKQAVIAQLRAVVDADVALRLRQGERAERRLRDLFERIDAAARLRAAGEQ